MKPLWIVQWRWRDYVAVPVRFIDSIEAPWFDFACLNPVATVRADSAREAVLIVRAEDRRQCGGIRV